MTRISNKWSYIKRLVGASSFKMGQTFVSLNDLLASQEGLYPPRGLDQSSALTGGNTASWTKWSLRLLPFLTAWKVPKYGVFSGPYFPAFGLNTERYSVSVCIQSECEKIRARKNSVSGHFSRSVKPIIGTFVKTANIRGTQRMQLSL